MPKFNYTEELGAQKAIPIIAGLSDPKKAVALAGTLKEAGIKVMELPVRGDVNGVMESIAAIRRKVPQMIVGAGTLMDRATVARAKDAGAHFGVCPGLTDEVSSEARTRSLSFIPGVTTITEAMNARRMYDVLKWYPAEVSGGASQLAEYASIMGPDMKWLPMGKITAAKLDDYARIPQVVTCGVSWLTPKELIQAEDWNQIAELAKSVIK